MHSDDSDMKIAPEKLSELFDSSEGAATAFQRETQNGNMERARQLGRQLAQALTDPEKGIVLFGLGAYDDEVILSQRKLMFAYVVGKVLNDLCPNSMVAQSAMSTFDEEVCVRSKEIHDLITDSAAYSLYTLSVRSAPDDPCAIGKIFAQLCKRGEDPLFVKYGCELAGYFTSYCTDCVLASKMVR